MHIHTIEKGKRVSLATICPGLALPIVHTSSTNKFNVVNIRKAVVWIQPGMSDNSVPGCETLSGYGNGASKNGPGCTAETKWVLAHQQEITQRGYSIYFITGGGVLNLGQQRSVIEKKGLTEKYSNIDDVRPLTAPVIYPLYDQDFQFIKSAGAGTFIHNGKELANPCVVLISAEGQIEAKIYFNQRTLEAERNTEFLNVFSRIVTGTTFDSQFKHDEVVNSFAKMPGTTFNPSLKEENQNQASQEEKSRSQYKIQKM